MVVFELWTSSAEAWYFNHYATGACLIAHDRMPLRWSRVQAHVYVNLATIHDADERHRVTIMLFALTVIIDTTQFLLFFFSCF